jgi:glutamate-1-semialdehyde aminotransferase
MGTFFKGFKIGTRILSKAKSSIFFRPEAEKTGHGEDAFPLVVVKRGKGPYVYDYDGNRFVDLYLSAGSLLMGHAHPHITKMLKSWLGRGYAAGYITASHEILAHRFFHVYFGNAQWKPDELKWIFSDSSAAAKNALVSLLSAIGYNGNTYFMNAQGVRRLDNRNAHNPIYEMDSQSPDGLRPERGDFVFFTFDASFSAHDAEIALKRLHEKGVLIVTDETNFFSHLRFRAHQTLLSYARVRIFGSWTSSGFAFGAIAAQADIFRNSGDNSVFPFLQNALSLVSSPPLHKIKAAITFTRLLENNGGIDGLVEKHNAFFRMLDPRYFEQIDSMIYVKQGVKSPREYAQCCGRLLREGCYFPLVLTEPLALSYAHGAGILKNCAAKLNSIFQSIDR